MTRPHRTEAGSTRPMRVDDLAAVATPWGAAVSPDGTQVVYVLRTVDLADDRDVDRLWRVRDGHDPEPLTGGVGDGSPAWSPDGRRMAFVRRASGGGGDAGDGGDGGGAPQLWLLPVDGGEATRLTDLPLGAGAPQWSPDGRYLAFGAVVDPAGETADGDAAGRPVVADRLDYHPDGSGYLGTRRRHLHVVDVESGDCRQVTEGDWHVGALAWAPDSRRIAFCADVTPEGDLRTRCPVHVVDALEADAVARQVALGDGYAQAVTWTPDGTSLVVVGTAGAPSGHAHLLRVTLGGGSAEYDVVDLAPAFDRNVMAGGPAYPGATPVLTSDGKSVLFCARDRGCTHLFSVPLDGGEPQRLLVGEGIVVSGLSVAGSRAVTVRSTPDVFAEVVALDLDVAARPGRDSDAVTVLTDHAASLAGTELVRRVAREFTIGDGTVVQAWLLTPPGRPGPYPLLLDVHGGPHNAWNGAADPVHLYHQQLVATGWAVLLVNPRGSDGYGETFFTAVAGAWGEADAADFLEPVDALVAEGLADPDRLAVTGYSYGGFMTCHLTSRDHRFAAAVAGGVVTDLRSIVGTADDGAFFVENELGAEPWADPELYERLSPIARVHEVRTPTLVLHGADDHRCPVGQAQQWHYGLRARRVPSRLVLYPGASHLFIVEGRPSHRRDYNERVVDWLTRHVPDPTEAPSAAVPASDTPTDAGSRDPSPAPVGAS
ncbi:S9 family peptidase [Terracoccus luteus]|uniref:Dipeptidyl aminopeptidase/acylaminoacyl peptidase n=1 Tax=Terracoccus luteus TaxID=53356 RepID=A0A839PXC6_9MICO|nr:S9 family peptidase [Terracoccus luteus]MBB2986685.1 dipeptidyl aminopeptidase/acylaminoacyl peptidase [Terracoccus luteus]MCP2172336.1 dipeptidyl aminopeptidase/acylaminoacyl peptidase [Terracoccus luteus]